ncbi:MAG: DUF1573 domain-containing protein [Bacteroidetes bacterium]|nr:MAG: DUF1573 domain-containing protein [Bacteroidota bacterium]
MYKKHLSIVLFYFLSFSVFAQGKIDFEKIEHNFGKIKEDGGLAEVIFTFQNKGNKPLSLTNVQASCGCTTPSWTKDPIAIGGTGTIKAAYDPMNRVGAFTKNITVISDGEPNTTILTITGEVLERVKGITDFYPVESGNLRFKNSFINFDQIYFGQTDTASTIVYNQGTSPISFDFVNTYLPAHLSVSSTMMSIAPQKTAILTFTFDGSKRKDWGSMYENLTIKTTDDKEPNKSFNISGNIVEDFSKVDLAKAPKISFNKTEHKFGTMGFNEKQTTVFTITNTGVGKLILRKVKASCGCTATDPKKMELAAGESTTVDVTYTSGSATGNQRKSVSVIANDPKLPETTLYIEADVVDKSENKTPESVVNPAEIKNILPENVVLQKPASVVEEGKKVVLESANNLPKIADYQIGSRVYLRSNFGKSKEVTVTGFVEEKNENKLKIRIADTEGKKNLMLDGIELNQNLIIWDEFQKWSLNKPSK